MFLSEMLPCGGYISFINFLFSFALSTCNHMEELDAFQDIFSIQVRQGCSQLDLFCNMYKPSECSKQPSKNCSTSIISIIHYLQLQPAWQKVKDAMNVNIATSGRVEIPYLSLFLKKKAEQSMMGWICWLMWERTLKLRNLKTMICCNLLLHSECCSKLSECSVS